MSDAPDPLRSLFQQAGQDGVRRARPAPVAHIAERGGTGTGAGSRWRWPASAWPPAPAAPPRSRCCPRPRRPCRRPSSRPRLRPFPCPRTGAPRRAPRTRRSRAGPRRPRRPTAPRLPALPRPRRRRRRVPLPALPERRPHVPGDPRPRARDARARTGAGARALPGWAARCRRRGAGLLDRGDREALWLYLLTRISLWGTAYCTRLLFPDRPGARQPAPLLTAFERWDWHHYLHIARDGYFPGPAGSGTTYGDNREAFFPASRCCCARCTPSSRTGPRRGC